MRARGRKRWVSAACVAAIVAGVVSLAYAGAEDWNDKAIKWWPYEQGLAQARKTKKPICLIFYTTWCPHCANFSKVFQDPAVVKKAESFVMIRVDKDKYPDISKQYTPDGEYIPRTYFLSASGQLDPSLTEAREQYKYFYDERGPAGILAGMDRALKKFD